MTETSHQPSELLKLGSHEYFVYELADRVEKPPNSFGVMLARHGSPKFSIHCTASFANGKLTQVHTLASALADSDEERMMSRFFDRSPELQGFVRKWIEYCYWRYAIADASGN
jgi:hypothetical protein